MQEPRFNDTLSDKIRRVIAFYRARWEAWAADRSGEAPSVQ